jgi:hypothetical protein
MIKNPCNCVYVCSKEERGRIEVWENVGQLKTLLLSNVDKVSFKG